MGCDIHIYIEVRRNNKWEFESEFDMNRSYGTFGFMANVRNYSQVPSLTQPDYNIPYEDNSYEIKEHFEFSDRHSRTCLTLKQMLDFNYEQTFEDRRCMRNGNGASICEIGEGEIIKFKDFLSPDYFKLINELKSTQLSNQLNSNDVRIIFDFDN